MSRGVTGLTQDEEYALLAQLRECQTELISRTILTPGCAAAHVLACYGQVAEAIAAERKIPVEVLKSAIPKAEVYSVETITAWLQLAKANAGSLADSPTLADISNKLRSAEEHWRHVASRAGVYSAVNGERTMAPATPARITGLSRTEEDNLLAQLRQCQADLSSKGGAQHSAAAAHAAACFNAVVEAIAIGRAVTVDGLTLEIPKVDTYDVQKITGWVRFASANASSAARANQQGLPALDDIANKLRTADEHWSYVAGPAAALSTKENVPSAPAAGVRVVA